MLRAGETDCPCPPPSRYFEEIFNASGNLELVQKYGDWFTYDKNPRAQIFRRNETQVRDVDSMVRLMRWVLPLVSPPSFHPQGFSSPCVRFSPQLSCSFLCHLSLPISRQVQQLPAGPTVTVPGLQPTSQR